MNDTPPIANDSKAQIIDKLRAVDSILVTVSADPTVDQLAACIGMTMVLNKLGKSATAVFSGKVPPVLEFLHPDETLQTTTDSLRDFIIAIDKSKADKLRYKLEDDVVKIFITPYKTSITTDDLQYSAGDFNVQLIVALGVQHQQDLDAAITAHGRIFHDAVTMSINAAPGGDFGSANWEDLNVSSLSEQIADLIDTLDPRALDADIATALLTGIVAETSRFSNARTRPTTLSASATLLAAGADQQLVNLKLQELIGTVVDLRAGDEITPTVKDPAALRKDVAEELVIDKSGAFQSAKNESTSADAQKPAGDDGRHSEPVKPDAAAAGAPPKSVESPRIFRDSEPAPAPKTAQIPDDDAASARKAVADALNGGQASTSSQSDQAVAPAPPIEIVAPASENETAAAASAPPTPRIAPEAYQNPLLNQSTQLQPMAVTFAAGPAQSGSSAAPAAPYSPAHEPAPLSMSPADQAFTMPMPPSSSIPASRPVFPPPPKPSMPAGDVPPPLPPPMMPDA